MKWSDEQTVQRELQCWLLIVLLLSAEILLVVVMWLCALGLLSSVPGFP